MVARLDGAKNDVPNDMFDVRSCYTLYFKPANGTILPYLPYDGDETKDDIIAFIRDNRSIQNMYLMPQSSNQLHLTDEIITTLLFLQLTIKTIALNPFTNLNV
ncbi:putative protein disulfide-isomerase [Helianthus anomalus]